MNRVIELIKEIFKVRDESIKLDVRFEFRINSKEKELINKYCDLKNISASEFLRNIAMKEIDKFIQINNR